MAVIKNKKKIKVGALKKAVVIKVKNDTQIVADIIKATGKSYPTVMRWLDENSELLTTVKCLNVICEGLNITQAQALNN